MKPPNRWLDRRIAKPGPFLTLCLTPEEFDYELSRLGVRARPQFVSPGSDATVHHMSNDKGEALSLVCMHGFEERDPIEVAGLLVHESVHIWQEYADMMGETNPGREQEAYAIQSISQELMAEFARRMQCKRT